MLRTHLQGSLCPSASSSKCWQLQSHSLFVTVSLMKILSQEIRLLSLPWDHTSDSFLIAVITVRYFKGGCKLSYSFYFSTLSLSFALTFARLATWMYISWFTYMRPDMLAPLLLWVEFSAGNFWVEWQVYF